jgi:hypothetical protein
MMMMLWMLWMMVGVVVSGGIGRRCRSGRTMVIANDLKGTSTFFRRAVPTPTLQEGNGV